MFKEVKDMFEHMFIMFRIAIGLLACVPALDIAVVFYEKMFIFDSVIIFSLLGFVILLFLGYAIGYLTILYVLCMSLMINSEDLLQQIGDMYSFLDTVDDMNDCIRTVWQWTVGSIVVGFGLWVVGFINRNRTKTQT